MKVIFALVAGLFLSLSTFAQLVKDPATWSVSVQKQPARVGDVVEVRIQATLTSNWHIYSNDLDPNIGPLPTTFKFTPNDGYQLIGKVVPVGVEEVYEKVWDAKIRQFSGRAQFVQKVKLLKPNATVGGTVEYMACSSIDGTCLPPKEVSFSTDVKAVAAADAPKPATVATDVAAAPQPVTETPTIESTTTPDTLLTTDGQTVQAIEEAIREPEAALGAADVAPVTDPLMNLSLWSLVLVAFVAGLTGLATPCVYPIIPMTVSFFVNQKGGTWKALLYGLSIVLIYVFFGTVIAALFGQAAPNFISTHWLPNLLFFAIFFVFGLSFLGLFELTLPSSLINKMDAQSEKGGFSGIFFMAFTLVLVSFSCTGPLVGSILGLGSRGEILKPVVGMFGYSMAFALPFTLFALFPQWLKSLPKSGGWLNSVKVVLGFLELALALKFLSIADQVYHWGLLDREVYLAFWIVIFALIGFYLLGKIRLPHDSETKFTSVPRMVLAIGTFAFVVYMVPGLWGAPLRALSGYLPPKTSQDFDLYERPVSSGAVVGTPLSETPKYADLFELPHKLNGFFDYTQGLAYAEKVNKPVFIDFTGHGCVNCREMEANVWSDPAVLERLRNDFVIVALYVDDKTELPQAQWYTSPYDQKVKKTIGAQNADLQITKYNNNAQPHYCLVDSSGKLLVSPKNYDRSVASFVAFLDAGKARFTK